MNIKKRHSQREGVATVEFAICLPLLLIVGFGFINVAKSVQLRHNAKIIGHLAATDLFVSFTKDPTAVAHIEAKYEQMAEDLGINGFEVEITETDDIALVKTSMSVSSNSSIPAIYQTIDLIETETYVYSPLQ